MQSCGPVEVSHGKIRVRQVNAHVVRRGLLLGYEAMGVWRCLPKRRYKKVIRNIKKRNRPKSELMLSGGIVN